MKNVLLILLLLGSSLIANAQNYKCLQPGLKHYFINNVSYLRGIRIDSVRTVGTSVVYYPFKTIRGRCLPMGPAPSTIGGSWLGSRVEELPDGTFIFDNYRQDSTIIKTNAVPGDSWIFYSDSSALFYRATVLTADTMTVLGTLDSIKTIVINAYNGAGIVTSDTANGFQIILSKNNGFVQIFDLYMFPYHEPNGTGHIANYTDFYYEKCDAQIFKLTPFTNALITDLNDVQPGDVFEYYFMRQYTMSMDHEGYRLDTILSNTLLPGGLHEIKLKRRTWTMYRTYPYGQTVTDAIINNTIYPTPVFDTIKMPEENGLGDLYYFNPNDNSFCQPGNWYASNSGILFNYFEPCGTYISAKAGLGNITTSTCYDPAYNGAYSTMKYANKNGIACGSFTTIPPTAIEAVIAPPTLIAVFPNPAHDVVTITSETNITDIALYNLLGQEIYTHSYQSKNIQIDIADLKAGVYTLKINGYDFKKLIKQ